MAEWTLSTRFGCSSTLSISGHAAAHLRWLKADGTVLVLILNPALYGYATRLLITGRRVGGGR